MCTADMIPYEKIRPSVKVVSAVTGVEVLDLIQEFRVLELRGKVDPRYIKSRVYDAARKLRHREPDITTVRVAFDPHDSAEEIILSVDISDTSAHDLLHYFVYGKTMKEVGKQRGACESAVSRSIKQSIQILRAKLDKDII